MYYVPRNYLRASRGISTMISQPQSCIAVRSQNKHQLCDESEEKLSVPELGQREILSFAYQVAKGMKYLSDLKVCKWSTHIHITSIIYRH